jgi:hypothetical protein
LALKEDSKGSESLKKSVDNQVESYIHLEMVEKNHQKEKDCAV